MAKAVLLLLALLALLTPAGADRKRTQRAKGDHGDSSTQAVDDNTMMECLIENNYKWDGVTEKTLTFVTGFPKRYCNMKCRKMLFTSKPAKVGSNVQILAFELDMIDNIQEPKEMWNVAERTCTCKTKQGEQLLPTFRNLKMCTKENCWQFHKDMFNIEAAVNAWQMKDEGSCGNECPTEGSCDRIVLGNVATDSNFDKMLAPGADTSGLTSPEKKLLAKYKNLIKDAPADMSVAKKTAVSKLEWETKKDARCSKPCDDGGDAPYLIDAHRCLKDGKPAHATLCRDLPTPDPRPRCMVMMCRAAWSTEPVESVGRTRGGKNAPVNGALAIDGPWIRKGAKQWNGLVISDTTPTSATLSIKDPHRASPEAFEYGIRIEPESRLTFTDEIGKTHRGIYDNGAGTITWEQGEGTVDWRKDDDVPSDTWVRLVSQENTMPDVVGAWAAEGSGEYQGTFDFAPDAADGTFTTLILDGQATEHQAKIVQHNGPEYWKIQIQYYGPDGTELEGQPILQAALAWDPDTGAEKLTWEPAKSTPGYIKPSTWVRMWVPTISAGSFGACSQSCVAEGEKATGRQERKVECVVETGGLFSGKWQARTDAACDELMTAEDKKPALERLCDPSPPPCGNWIVVCRGNVGEVAGDDACAGEKPTL